MIKRTPLQNAFTVVNTAVLAALALVTLYPLLYVVLASFSNPTLFAKHTGPLFWTQGFSLDAYKVVLEKPEILTGYGNTLFYVVVGTAVNMAFTISLAYVTSRPGLLLNKPIMLLIIFTMYFNGGLIPTYLLVQDLGLVDTRWAPILPTAISTFNLIILRTGFAGVPVSLEEAAKIDGASPFRIMVKIIFPLAMPTIAVIVLYYAVQHWNSWFQEMIYLRDDDLYPLQLFLRQILIENQQDDMVMATKTADQQALGEIIKYSTIIVSTVPILLVYPFLQKYFTKGVMIGAVKG
ncbi:MAG: carbohydrate ABC transporter permease [Clostridia bacterium]|nr:carbohydrate ABC transporter permease [Clostridia bacterium]